MKVVYPNVGVLSDMFKIFTNGYILQEKRKEII